MNAVRQGDEEVGLTIKTAPSVVRLLPQWMLSGHVIKRRA